MASAVPIVERRCADGKARVEAGWKTVQTVAQAYGSGIDEGQLEAVFRTLTRSWNECPSSAALPWSGLGADASGCDVSLVFGGRRSELRLTVEAQGYPASPATYWNAARKLSEQLAISYGADLSQLREIEDLVGPFAGDAAGVLWHGAVLSKGRAPWFKVYLHLMSSGRSRARGLTQSLLQRLGVSGVWPDIVARLGEDDELLFLCFDLIPEDSRIKLYIRHGNQTAEGLTQASRVPGPSHDKEVAFFVDTLMGSAGDTIRRGALTSLHLKDGEAVAARATTHIRLYPHCATSDAALFARLRRVLNYFGIAPQRYEAVIAALAGPGLDQQEGIHGWASLQWGEQDPVVTVYLSPKLHFARYGPIGLDPERMWPSPVSQFP